MSTRGLRRAALDVPVALVPPYALIADRGFRDMPEGGVIHVAGAATPAMRFRGWSLPALVRRLDVPLLLCAELVVLLRFRNAAWTGFGDDQFTLLYDSSRIVHGQVPYRDFFQFIGPGTLWVQAAWMAVFGVDASGPQVLLALVLAVLGLGLYLLTLRLTDRRPLALFAPAFVLLELPAHWPWPYHHWYGVTAMVWTLLAMSAWLRGDRARWLVLAGAGCVVTGLFVQTYGAALVLGLVAFLVIQARGVAALARWVGLLATGLCVALAPVLAYFALVGGMSRMFYDTVLWAPGHYLRINEYPFAGDIGYWMRWGLDPTWGSFVNRVLDPGPALWAVSAYTALSGGAALVLPLVGVALGGFLALEAAGLQLLGAPAPEGAARNLLTACGLVAFASFVLMVRVRADMIHLAWATIVAYPVLLGCAGRRLRRPVAVRTVTASLGALAAAAGVWFATLTAIPGATATMDDVASRDPVIAAVRDRTAPGDEIAFIGLAGRVYFYGRPAAVGYTLVLPVDDLTSPDEIEEIRREVAVNRPKIVVFGVGISCTGEPGPRGCLFPVPDDYGGADGSAVPDRLEADNAIWWIYTRHGPPATPSG